MIIPYSQKDPRWKDRTINYTKLTMKNYGCFIVSLAILDGRSPDLVLTILTAKNCFTPQGLLISKKAAEALDIEYDGIAGSEDKPNHICIAETHQFRWMGYAQHFFVWKPDGYIIDPLDGKEKMNRYRVASYRLFYPKERKGALS